MAGRCALALLLLLWCAVSLSPALDYEFPDPEVIVLPAPGTERESVQPQQPRADPQSVDQPQSDAAADAPPPPKRKKVKRKKAAEATPYTPTYDALPRTFADMSEYDKIAMEPYADRYDSAPLHEKAALYAAQFEFMNGRPPEYHPVDVAEIEVTKQAATDVDSKKKKGRKKKNAEPTPPAPATEAGDVGEPDAAPEAAAKPKKRAAKKAASFDPLPRKLADMDQYDRIAMSPYEETYNTLPLHERAELYARQFEFMRDRPPAFAPADVEAIEASRENPELELAESQEADAEPASEQASPQPPPAPSLRSAPTTRYTLRPPSFFDPFPRQFADMDTYARMFMEPFKDNYDKMSVHARADLFATQFEQTNGRLPVYSPADLDEIENSRELAAAAANPAAEEHGAEASASRGEGGPTGPQAGKKRVVSVKSKAPGRGVYDALPRKLSELPEYFREAMEPYRDTYDDLPINEKAEFYAREFEELRGREPVFSPLTIEEIEKSVKKQRGPDRYVTYEERRKERLYNEAPRRRSKIDGVDMTAIAGPWEANRKPEPKKDEEDDDEYFGDRPKPGSRMDSLQRGWLRDREKE